jgi:hypothetical protein
MRMGGRFFNRGADPPVAGCRDDEVRGRQCNASDAQRKVQGMEEKVSGGNSNSEYEVYSCMKERTTRLLSMSAT